MRLSAQAFETVLEVLAANRVGAMIEGDSGYTPTPAVSHAIRVHRQRWPDLWSCRRHRDHAVAQSA